MADLSFKQMRAKLDTRLNDAGNVVWDSAFKDEFMNEALADPYVYVIDRDKTTTTVANGVEYPVPGGVDDVVFVGLDINSNGNTKKLSEGAYEVINGIIIIDPFYYQSIPVGITMIVAGPRHLTNTDLIPTAFQEYVLQLSMVAAYEWLASKLGSRFLTNDMTMADLLNKKAAHERRVAELRRTLPNRYMTRF